MLTFQAEAYSKEVHYCPLCKRSFKSRVVTWIDVSRTPGIKSLLLNSAFNIVTCSHCGNRLHSDAPFFYEDFAEGLLVAVFPRIPADHLSIEADIRQEYSYYPTLEFFYDMTQLWFLIYLQEYYKTNMNSRETSAIDEGEKRLRTLLRFLKKDPLILTICETLTNTFLERRADEDLQKVLWCALVKLEGIFQSLGSFGIYRTGCDVRSFGYREHTS